ETPQDPLLCKRNEPRHGDADPGRVFFLVNEVVRGQIELADFDEVRAGTAREENPRFDAKDSAIVVVRHSAALLDEDAADDIELGTRRRVEAPFGVEIPDDVLDLL